MEWQPRTFSEMQRDERLKRLERQLKLTQIRRSSGSQLLLASHLSTSGISSIHGDNQLSDFSYHIPTTNSSKVGSVIVASSNNLRKKVLKNVDVSTHLWPSNSTDIEPAINTIKTDKDTIMMPPPVATKNLKSKSSNHMGQQSSQQDVLVNGTDAATDRLVLGGYANDSSTSIHNIPPMHDSSRTDHFFLPQNQPALQQSARNSDTSKQHVRNFRNWVVRLNNRGQIIVKGKLESGEQARSKAVRRRLNANTLISVLNHKYRLVGDLCDSRGELPIYVRRKFSKGFPADWENVHQVWQSYVASGCSSSFRWPRPIADSDDDIRSDITELPTSRPKYTSNNSTSIVPPSSPHQRTTQISKSFMNGEASLEQAHIPKCSVSSIEILASANSDQAITSKLVSSSENSVRNQSTQTSMQPERVAPFEDEKYIPRWKIDAIIGNMMDKNCPKEYFDKVVTAIDCINELFKISSTNITETANNAGIFLNYNSKVCADMSSTQIDTQMRRAKVRENQNQVNLRYETPTASKADSYSLESLSEPELDPPSKNTTYLYKESREMKKHNITGCGTLESLPNNNMMLKSHSHLLPDNLVSNDQNNLNKGKPTITSDNMRYGEHRKNLTTSALPIEQRSVISLSNSRYNQQNILQTTDSEAEVTYSNMQKAALPNNFTPTTTTSRITRKSKPKPVATDQGNDSITGPSHVYCESDVSIVTACITPSAKTKISTAEGKSDGSRKWHYEKDTSLMKLESSKQTNDDHCKISPSKPADTANSSALNILPSPSARSFSKCAVVLNKITIPQRNVNRSSQPIANAEHSAGYHKSRLEIAQEKHEVPDNVSENLSMRTSSRGRCLIPPLDYWNGERLMLKGQTLVYNPGMPHTGNSSAVSGIFRHSMTSPTSGVQSSFKKDKKIDGVLFEISDNRNTCRSHETTDQKLQVTPSNKVSSRVRHRRRRVVTLSSSDSDENHAEQGRRGKRKRIR